MDEAMYGVAKMMLCESEEMVLSMLMSMVRRDREMVSPSLQGGISLAYRMKRFRCLFERTSLC